MHSVLMVYNNFVGYYIIMEQKQIQKIKEQELNSYFPRIIREFNDGPDEKPALYRGWRE